VAQAPAIGLIRVILNEHSNLCWRAIDLPAGRSLADATSLWNELSRKDAEREIALRGEARYVRRLDRGRPSREQWLDPGLPLRLESRERGHLDTLHFAPFESAAVWTGSGIDRSESGGNEFPRRAQGARALSG
jgi:hypothetical protein